MPLWKDLDPVVNMVSVEETGRILKLGFAHSLNFIPIVHEMNQSQVWHTGYSL